VSQSTVMDKIKLNLKCKSNVLLLLLFDICTRRVYLLAIYR
jgi:hypothetical protein